MLADELIALYNEGRRDFRGEDLSYQKLELRHLAQIDLRGANLTGTSFQLTYMSECDLRGAIIVDTDFRDADLSASIIIEGCDLWRAQT